MNSAFCFGGMTRYSLRHGLISFFERAAHRIEVRLRHDPARDDVLGQQTDGPERVPGRRLGTGERRQLRLGFAVEDRRNRRRLALLAREHRVEPLGRQLLARAHDHRSALLSAFSGMRALRIAFANALPLETNAFSHSRPRASSSAMYFLAAISIHPVGYVPDGVKITVRSGCT
jgi:hypothetical protein